MGKNKSKTYSVEDGPLTINNIPPQKWEFIDDSGNKQLIPAGIADFRILDKSINKYTFTTDDLEQQLWLEKNPNVTLVREHDA